MPNIYDNIESTLSQGLSDALANAYRADFCVGYFHLRGWDVVSEQVEKLPGGLVQEKEGQKHRVVRLLVGMQKAPEEIVREHLRSAEDDNDLGMDQQTALHLRRKMAHEFRQQLTLGIPTDVAERTLRTLQRQLQEGKVAVKLHLRHTLHAKLYLAFTSHALIRQLGFVGSSNLTMPGLSKQGELNVDVKEDDAVKKLAKWFDDRWNDRWSIDITADLIEVLKESWVEPILPYHVYLKIAYHLSQEAREGINEFRIPAIFRDQLLPFQREAVLIAAKKLHTRGVVMIGDVVGLGKTITACALARIYEEDFYYSTLVICPPKLIPMWQSYADEYDLKMRIMSLGQVKKLEELRRYQLIIIDESHNLRSSEGNRYKAIREYISQNDNKVVLLTATPYNKSFVDLSNQLRLALPDDKDLGISPEYYIRSLGGAAEFNSLHSDTYIRSIKAFERSEIADDWRDLMRLFMVRRTRSFIKNIYGKTDPANSRKYLEFADGTRSYFPVRLPKKVEYAFDPNDPNDIYARLYSPRVVDDINSLELPRYGLAQYVRKKLPHPLTKDEELLIKDLTRAGKRLKGFTRTNLYKRLESSGYAFLLSLARHTLRNFLFIHAIDNGLPIPIGKTFLEGLDDYLVDEEEDGDGDMDTLSLLLDETTYRKRAAELYAALKREKYHWIDTALFETALGKDLLADAKTLIGVLKLGNNWDPANDKQLNALHKLVSKTHKNTKVLIFTQYADTAYYLNEELAKLKVGQLACATGGGKDLTTLTRRFSPKSNRMKDMPESQQVRVLVATDVLSEGQNLQDAHIIVNYDLPWAIIRLIQRAGRVDRIGQQAEKIYCYSFLPEDGLENIINLRGRLRARISENAEVVGSDEVFFEGDPVNLADLYNEKAGLLDDEEDTEVDLASLAYQIWHNATHDTPALRKAILEMPNVRWATKENTTEPDREGVVVYARIDEDHDMLAWLNTRGQVVSQSPYTILKAVECTPDTPPLGRLPQHHSLVGKAVRYIYEEVQELDNSIRSNATLGKRNSIKYRLYHQLTEHLQRYEKTLLEAPSLKKAIDDIMRAPLREGAKEVLGRQLKTSSDPHKLVELVLDLHDNAKLVVLQEETTTRHPQIICSMGLKNG